MGGPHEKPADRFARAELLIGVEHRAPAPRERVESRVVPRDALRGGGRHRYPVPLEWAGSSVEVRIQAEEI